MDEIEKHLKSLRTSYTKLCHMPSGSAADQLCSFLKAHIRSRAGISNLPRQASPRMKVRHSAHPN